VLQFVSSIGKHTAQTLGFKRGSAGSACTQICIAFLISGLIHAAGDIHMGKQYWGLSLGFFLLQALAILLEDAVIGLAARAGLFSSSFLVRLIGYGWVFMWFTFLMPSMMRFTKVPIFPFSPVGMGLAILEQRYNLKLVSRFIPPQ
jgi:hypothetical protein